MQRSLVTTRHSGKPGISSRSGSGTGIVNGIAYGMLAPMSAILVLDKAGRLVLPKAIRDRMHLCAGSKLRVEMVGDKLELTQEAAEVRIERRGKRRVVVGWEGFDAVRDVQEAREEHLDRLEAPVSQ